MNTRNLTIEIFANTDHGKNEHYKMQAGEFSKDEIKPIADICWLTLERICDQKQTMSVYVYGKNQVGDHCKSSTHNMMISALTLDTIGKISCCHDSKNFITKHDEIMDSNFGFREEMFKPEEITDILNAITSIICKVIDEIK